MIIIDGHNLLHAIHKADEGFESISDVKLCRIIGRHLRLTGERGEIYTIYAIRYKYDIMLACQSAKDML